MNVDDFVKKNNTYSFLSKGAIRKTQTLIEENEKLLYALVTNVEMNKKHNTSFENQSQLFGGAMQLKDVLSGVVAITDKRIIFCNSTLGTTNDKQMMIKDIQSIDEHISGLTKTGEVRVVGITETFVIKILRKGLNEDIKKAIDKAKNMENKEKNIGNALSNADEIRKYMQLYEDGIITKEEFESKKRELLK